MHSRRWSSPKVELSVMRCSPLLGQVVRLGLVLQGVRLITLCSDTSRHRQSRSHHRSGSLTATPPPPPPFFNPPADHSSSLQLNAVSPPPSGPPSASTSSLDVTISQYFSDAPMRDHLQAQLDDLVKRPGLRALQRVSYDSLTGPSSGNSSGTYSSEGGEHLAEMRERVLSDPSGGEGSGSGTGFGGDGGNFEFQVINPTPPTIPRTLVDQPSPGLETSGRRSSRGTLSTSPGEGADSPPEHAWDSVVSG